MKVFIYQVVKIFAFCILWVIPLFADEGENTFFKEMEKAIYPEDVTYTARMTILRPGKEYKKVIKVYIQGYEKSLIEFLEPPQERGTKILMIGDNMWMYLPSVEKIIRLSGKTKVMGGEFIYDDILRAKLTIDYYVESMEKDEKQTILNLKAKDKIAAYDKIRLIVNSDNYLPIRGEFYTIGGILLKTLDYSEYTTFGKKIIPARLLMQLAVSSDYKTIIEIIKYDDNKIPKRIFSQEYLKKGL